MNLIPPAAQSLGCRALEDRLLYVYFLLALAGFVTAGIFAVNWFLHSFSDGDASSQKQNTFSKGASR